MSGTMDLKATMDAALRQLRTDALPCNGSPAVTAGGPTISGVLSLVYAIGYERVRRQERTYGQVPWSDELIAVHNQQFTAAARVQPEIRLALVDALDNQHANGEPCVTQIAWYLLSNGTEWLPVVQARELFLRVAGDRLAVISAVLQQVANAFAAAVPAQQRIKRRRHAFGTA